jgi:hypothetical protein
MRSEFAKPAFLSRTVVALKHFALALLHLEEGLGEVHRGAAFGLAELLSVRR